VKKFVADEVALLQVTLRVIWNYPINNMLLLSAEQIEFYITLKKQNSFWYLKSTGQ